MNVVDRPIGFVSTERHALKYLESHHLQCLDLAPLACLPLIYLNCGGTKVADLTPLRGIPLPSGHKRHVVSGRFTSAGHASRRFPYAQKIVKGIDILRANKSLKGSAAGRPRPVSFARRVLEEIRHRRIRQARRTTRLAYLDPAFEKWTKDVQALPAESRLRPFARS